jgi:ATP-binding cassette subfamily G (WHITE) protein 1
MLLEALSNKQSQMQSHLFDDLILMAEGRIVYSGPAKHVIHYFSKLNFTFPTYSNPADYIFMSILNTEMARLNKQEKEGGHVVESAQARTDMLIQSWQTSSESSAVQNEVLNPRSGGISSFAKKFKSSFTTQFKFLFQRASYNAFRNPLIVRAKLAQVVVISLIIGCLYLNTDDLTGYSGHQNRIGLLFFLSINNVMSSTIGVLSIFGQERRVFRREYNSGYYGLPSYFFSKIMVEVPFQIVLPWVGATIVYWMAGLQPYADKYFINMVFVVLASITGFALGIFFACVFSDLETALTIAPLILLPLMVRILCFFY